MCPKISVIMAVYNTPEEWLKKSIESILHQTFGDFEFIISLDCPTDNSEEIVDSYSKQDNRIVVVKNIENRGLTRNLYDAVNMAKGEYIARMDSDDVCELNRFETQVLYLDENRDVSVLGTYVRVFSENKSTIGMINLSENMEINRIRSLFYNPGIAHPSAMIRKSFLEEKKINYRLEYKKSQDYGLWVDILNNDGIIREVPNILLNYRVHDNQISKKNKEEQNSCVIQIIESQLNQLLDDYDIKLHLGLNAYDSAYGMSDYIKYIKKLIRSNKLKKKYDYKAFNREILAMWQKIVLRKVKQFRFHYLFSITSLKSFNLSVIKVNYLKYVKRKKYFKMLVRKNECDLNG